MVLSYIQNIHKFCLNLGLFISIIPHHLCILKYRKPNGFLLLRILDEGYLTCKMQYNETGCGPWSGSTEPAGDGENSPGSWCLTTMACNSLVIPRSHSRHTFISNTKTTHIQLKFLSRSLNTHVPFNSGDKKGSQMWSQWF